MFRITHIKFHNICQYTDMESPINEGLTAVCGANGIGKTNCLRAITYALTGLVDGSWGNQQRLQQDGTADPGYAEVRFTGRSSLHCGTFEIRRYSTSSTKFPDRIVQIVDETETVVAARRSAVDKFMGEILGIPVSLFFQICWGRQGQLDNLLTAPAAAINTFLASVFDTKYLDKLREKLKSAIDSIATFSPTCKTQLEEATEALKALDPVENLERRLTAAKTQARGLSAAVTDLKARKGNARSADLLDRDKEVTAEQLKQVRAELAKYKESPEPANPDMSKQAIQAYLDERNSFLDTKNQQYAKISSSMSAIDIQVGVLKDALNKYRKEVEDTVSNLTSTHDTVCHLCKGQIVDREAYERERWKLVTTFETEEEYRASAEREIQQHETFITAQEKRMEELKKELDEICDEVKTGIREVDEAKELLKYAEAWERWYDEHQKFAQHKRMEAVLSEHLEQLNKAVVFSVEDATKLEMFEQDLVNTNEMIQSLQEQIADRNAKRKYLEQVIETNTKAVEQYEINTEARKILTNLRDVYSQQRAQARYLNTKVTEINKRIAEYLEETSMPFSLYLNEQTHVFEYKTTAGYIHPASHLSGAQKNISSVILQMTLLSVIEPDMNLFLIDEPSEALDVQNKFIMSELFQKLNNLLPAIEGVMLIVSRDEQIIDSCSNVLQLSDMQEV